MYYAMCLVRCNASQNEKWGYLAAAQRGFHRFPSVPLGFFTANKKNSVKSSDNHKAQNKHVWGAGWARWAGWARGARYLCVLPFDCGRRWPTVRRPAVCGLSEINIRLFAWDAVRRVVHQVEKPPNTAELYARLCKRNVIYEYEYESEYESEYPYLQPKLKLVLRLDSLYKYLRCIWQLPEIVDFVCIYIHTLVQLYGHTSVCVCVWLCGWRGLRDLYRLHEIIC